MWHLFLFSFTIAIQVVFQGPLCKLLPANLPVTDRCTPTWCPSGFLSTWVSCVFTVDRGLGVSAARILNHVQAGPAGLDHWAC